MASTQTKLGVLKKSSPSSVSKAISKEASPDSKCPICLDQFKNISYVDTCLHRFCFRCIHEWSKNKAECPLCKQPFGSIYHSVRAEDDFQQYDLRPSDNGSFGSLAGQRFRYRTTLTGDRRPERRTSPPPDHGVMFEGLSGSVSGRNDHGFRRMLERLAARRRAQGEGRTLRTVQEQEMIRFRRTLYRRGLRVRGVRDGGRSRETSAEFFKGNPACLHRLVPWLKRELMVLYGSHGSLVNIVQHIIMSQITRYDLQDPAVVHELRPFLLSRTEHFLHEFQSFAQSPFNMEAYDQNAVYDCPAPSVEDSGGSGSSIITVSEDDAGLPRPEAPAVSAMLSQTPWDDETPGPSYSSGQPPVLTVSITSSDLDSEEEEGPSTTPVAPARAGVGEEDHSSGGGGEDDCFIVGYVKPTADRTPELVQLSSDSEEEETGGNRISQPQHIRFTSPQDTPTSPGSSQSAAHRHASLSRSHEPCPSASRHPSNSCPQKIYEDRRQHSKSKRKERSRSRNASSRGHRSLHCSKDRKQEPSSHHSSHKHHRYSMVSDTRSRDRPRERSRDRPRERSRDRPRELSRDRPRELSRDRPRELSRDRPRELSRDRPRERSRDRPCERLRDRPRERSRDRSCERSRVRSRERSRVRSRERSRDQSRERSRDRPRERSRDQSRERSRDRPRERSRDRPRERSRSRIQSPGWNGSRSRTSRTSSPSSSHKKSRHSKPGGKRKYKSLHLEPSSGAEATEAPAMEKMKRSREKGRKGRRSSRSAGVEIQAGERLRKHHKKRKKHKKRRSEEGGEKPLPLIITINSESDSEDRNRSPPPTGSKANETNEADSSVTANHSPAGPSPDQQHRPAAETQSR